MAKRAASTRDDDEEVKQEAPAQTGVFVPPEADAEFVFADVASLPEWADKGWAGVDESSGDPVLRVPGMTYPDGQPYHTNVARVGDTVKWDSKKKRLTITSPEPEAA
jgi:hypothetical protein